MKLIARILSLVYRYVTAFIVVSSPLFFIPGTGFAPDVTYYVVITLAIAIALIAYVAQAFLQKTWHSISRFELAAYAAFSLAVILSALFAKDPRSALFGYGLNPYSAVSLLGLPAIMYLVRTLPDQFRNRLKQILLGVLAVAAFLFMFTFMLKGTLAATIGKVFSGFTSSLSLVTYVGIFLLVLCAYLWRSNNKIKHKIPVIGGALVFLGVILVLGYQGDVRPNIGSSLSVSRNVLINNGVFGIGAGEYARAWQLYRPQSVLSSEYFNVDFNQASGTITTFLSTIGIIGVLAFLYLTLGSLLATFRLYTKTEDKQERFILGFITAILTYFALVAIVVPLSYSMLMVWAIVAGFGIAKMPLGTYHPSKQMMYVLIPLTALFIVHAHMTVSKTRAIRYYAQAQTVLTEKGPVDEVEALLAKAASIFPFDGFYRAQVEYAIARERAIVSNAQLSADEVKTLYLAKAQYAVDAGLNAVKANENNYQNYVAVGRAYELAIPFDKTAGYDNAKASYVKATELFPENPYLYVILARLEASAGSKEGVRAQLTEALKKKQNFADALYLMSQLEVSEERLDEALLYAVEAVKAAPNDANVYIQAGLLFYAKKDYQNAIASLQKALQLDQTNANTAYFLALSLRDGGQVDLAKQIGEELLKRNPGNADLEAFLKSVEPIKSATTTKPTSTKK